MSLAYNSGNAGILQLIERNLNFAPGDITGNTTRLSQFTSEVNAALDETWALIFKAGGTWQWDDSNQVDYPIITTALTTGQRDYNFSTDGSSNLILEIEKVLIRTSATGPYEEIDPIDVQSDDDTDTLTNGLNASGTPYRYDKTANGIFLDPIPSYTVSDGLKVYISREGIYFTVGDTTKKPGFAGIFHEYPVLVTSYKYAARKSLDNEKSLQEQMLVMRQALTDYYGAREKDVRRVLRGRQFNFR